MNSAASGSVATVALPTRATCVVGWLVGWLIRGAVKGVGNTRNGKDHGEPAQQLDKERLLDVMAA